MRTRLTTVAALVALAAGAGCIVVGRAVLAEPGQLAAARTALASPSPIPPPTAAGGVASALLGTGGDRAALRAATDALAAQDAAAAARTERELTTLSTAGPPDRRAWAATLLASLELARAGPGHAAQRHLSAALTSLRNAVAADPADEEAKRNLELLLTLQQRHRQRSRRHSAGNRPRRPKPRAGSSTPGYGW